MVSSIWRGYKTGRENRIIYYHAGCWLGEPHPYPGQYAMVNKCPNCGSGLSFVTYEHDTPEQELAFRIARGCVVSPF